jgi:hypothetical protein
MPTRRYQIARNGRKLGVEQIIGREGKHGLSFCIRNALFETESNIYQSPLLGCLKLSQKPFQNQESKKPLFWSLQILI